MGVLVLIAVLFRPKYEFILTLLLYLLLLWSTFMNTLIQNWTKCLNYGNIKQLQW